MPKRRFIFLFGYVRITNITVPAHGNRTCIPRPPSYYSVVSRKDPGIINFGHRSSLCRTVYIPSYDLPNKKFALFRLFLLVIVLGKFRRDMSLALRRVVVKKMGKCDSVCSYREFRALGTICPDTVLGLIAMPIDYTFY